VLWQGPELIFCQEAAESAQQCATNAAQQGSKRSGLRSSPTLWFNSLGGHSARGQQQQKGHVQKPGDLQVKRLRRNDDVARREKVRGRTKMGMRIK
jgi:hypothetical protein